ncbi:MAG: hypothetical protein ABI651_00485 [Verrucomicrobiota bacterium]
MKNNCSKVIAGFSSVVISLVTYHSASAVTPGASIIYDNTAATSYLNNFFSSNLEYGDDINFAGSKRGLTDISFEYNANIITYDNTEKVVFRLYKNDGLNGTPSTVLFDSNTIDAGGTPIFNGIQHVDIGGLNLQVPDNVTFTVQFSGLGPGESAGLTMYDPPSVGKSLAGGVIGSYDDFWENAGGTWTLFRFPNGNPAGNFGARFSAIPEASTVSYAMLGGLILLGSQAYRRFSTKHS